MDPKNQKAAFAWLFQDDCLNLSKGQSKVWCNFNGDSIVYLHKVIMIKGFWFVIRPMTMTMHTSVYVKYEPNKA